MDSKFVAREGFPVTALRETNILLALQHENIIRETFYRVFAIALLLSL
jgi:hypothetical protein